MIPTAVRNLLVLPQEKNEENGMFAHSYEN